MATWEQRRRGILRTALEMEQDLFAAENRYIAELRSSMTNMQLEFHSALTRMNAQPRSDGNFDWERWQTEALVGELDRQIERWTPQATSITQSGTSAADEMGAQYPLDILSAGGSDIRSQPRLGGTQLAMFHAYDAGLVKGVSDRTRAEITGLVRRAALGGDSVFSLIGKIGDVAGKGAFASAFHRGEAIIRTEMGRAYSSADMATMNATALDHPGLKKKWLSIIDGRTRPEHAKAHDQVRNLDQPFSVGGERLQHPHDTNGSAWNTINCRCKAVPWDPAWEKLPPPGTKQLGPLAMADTASFQQRLTELNRLNLRSQARTWADQLYRGKQRDMSELRAWMELDEELLDRPWPKPMNPAYWRSKPSFTLDELKLIASNPIDLAGFLRERYGITLVHDPFDMDNDFDTLMGTRLLQTLETYRALDPAFVVENERLRWIGSAIGGMGTGVMGEASVFGDIKFNSIGLDDVQAEGRKRDPAGTRLPRISADDPTLEIMLHEVAHSIGYQAGIPMAHAYNAAAALPPAAWDAWSKIHFSSTRASSDIRAIQALRDWLTQSRAALDAARKLGRPDSDPASVALLKEIAYLEDKVYALQAAEAVMASYPGGVYPTTYAATDLHEDFAESLTMARLQPQEFKTNYAPRYAWFETYMPKLVGA